MTCRRREKKLFHVMMFMMGNLTLKQHLCGAVSRNLSVCHLVSYSYNQNTGSTTFADRHLPLYSVSLLFRDVVTVLKLLRLLAKNGSSVRRPAELDGRCMIKSMFRDNLDKNTMSLEQEPKSMTGEQKVMVKKGVLAPRKLNIMILGSLYQIVHDAIKRTTLQIMRHCQLLHTVSTNKISTALP